MTATVTRDHGLTGAASRRAFDGRLENAEWLHLADGALVDGEIECRKHNGRFDARTGEASRKPARESICTYPVRRVGGRLVRDLTPSSPHHTVPHHTVPHQTARSQ